MFNIDANRLKTGLYLFAGVVTIFLFNNDYILWAVSSVILYFCISEMQDLLKIEDMFLPYVFGIILAFSSLFYASSYLIIAFLLILVVSYFAYLNQFNDKMIKILIYPLLPFSFFYALIFEYSIAFLIWVSLIVVCSDIGAYIVGKNIGKTAFSPTSPNKTLEGVGGALIISSICGSIYGYFYLDSWFMALVVSFIVSFSSIFGDLFESYLKRQADVKDSGNILAGHGGILDRMDGFLFAIPMMYILLKFLNI